MTPDRYDPTERIGVLSVALIFVEEFKWIFRETPNNDVGIDGEVEIVDSGNPKGRLIALQIKTGPSYLSEKTATGYIYRGKMEHLEYWRRHSLPVLIVLYDPVEKKAYFQVVSSENVILTEKAWKIEIPFNQVLEKSHADHFELIAEGTPDILRLRHLSLALPWMEELLKGNSIILESDEWVNKSSGRGSIKIMVCNSAGEVIREWEWSIMVGMMPYEQLFQNLFPWADIGIDEYFYEPYDEMQFELEYGHYAPPEDYQDYLSRLPEIRPYTEEAGEVAKYRLILELNDLGRAFLILNEYLNSGGFPIFPKFGPDHD